MHTNNTAITPDCTALLERVHQAKRLNRLTIARIADEAGMYRPTVTNQFNGRYNLDIRVVLAVARLCPNVSADYILRGEGDILSRSNDIDTPIYNKEQKQATTDNLLHRIELLEQAVFERQ